MVGCLCRARPMLIGVLLVLGGLGCGPTEEPSVRRGSDERWRSSRAEADRLIGALRSWLRHNPDYSERSTSRPQPGAPDVRHAFRIEEVTTDDVWREFGIRLVQVGYNDTFLVRGREVHPIHRGFFGGSIDQMCVTDFDGDGRKEVLYSSTVSLSGVYHGTVAVLRPREFPSPRCRMHLFSGFCASFRLSRIGEREVEVFSNFSGHPGFHKVGTLVASSNAGRPRARMEWAEDLSDRQKKKFSGGHDLGWPYATSLPRPAER